MRGAGGRRHGVPTTRVIHKKVSSGDGSLSYPLDNCCRWESYSDGFGRGSDSGGFGWIPRSRNGNRQLRVIPHSDSRTRFVVTDRSESVYPSHDGGLISIQRRSRGGSQYPPCPDWPLGKSASCRTPADGEAVVSDCSALSTAPVSVGSAHAPSPSTAVTAPVPDAVPAAAPATFGTLCPSLGGVEFMALISWR